MIPTIAKEDNDLLVARFHVYCKRSGCNKPYFRVLIFKNVRTMRQFLCEQAKLIEWRRFKRPGRRYYDNAYGCCTHWVPVPKSPFIGTVCLAMSHLGSNITTHELTHAAFYYVSSVLKLPITKMDEPLARVSGWLNCQYVRNYYRLKLDKRRK